MLELITKFIYRFGIALAIIGVWAIMLAEQPLEPITIETICKAQPDITECPPQKLLKGNVL